MGAGGDPNNFNCFFCTSSSVTSSECLEGSSWTTVKLLVAHLLQLTPELRWEPPPSFDERRRVYHRILEGTSEEVDVRRRICGDCLGIAERVSELHNEIQKVVQGLREVVVNSKRRCEDLEGDLEEVSKMSRKERPDVLRDFYGLVSTLVDMEKLSVDDVKVEEEISDDSESYSDVFNNGSSALSGTEVATEREREEKLSKRTNRRRRNSGIVAGRKRLTIKILKTAVTCDGGELEEENVQRTYSFRRRLVHGIPEEVEDVAGKSIENPGVEDDAVDAGEEEVDAGNDNDEDWSPGGGEDVRDCDLSEAEDKTESPRPKPRRRIKRRHTYTEKEEPGCAQHGGDREPNLKKKCDEEDTMVKNSQLKSTIQKPKLNLSRLICQICPEPLKFSQRTKLIHHLIHVHSRTDLGFICKFPNCSKVFLSKPELTRHNNIHLRRFICPVCNFACTTPWKLQRHCLIHSKPVKPEPPPNCNKCQAPFPDRLSLRKHTAKEHSPRHKCHLCPREYRSKSMVARHLKTVHRIGDLTGFTCDTCGRHFLEKNPFKYHVATHQTEKNFTCETCGFATTTRLNLRRHQFFMHSGERRHACPHCEKKFKVKALLMDHIRVHTRERPFQCDLCGKSYSTANILAKHKKNLHGCR